MRNTARQTRENRCSPQLLPLRVMNGSARLTLYDAHGTQRWTRDF
jgi:hypothetical protein